ncbi:hypothetical protein RJT34_17921 [Clitoria ternatea]|uniref:LysM domain-containing protein n=1 Tax=Clitoria ternatea TaxID=43366 RepID=A0AAN9JC17_CLITE
MALKQRKAPISSLSQFIVDTASWCCAILMVSLILLCILRDTSSPLLQVQGNSIKGNHPCDEIYVVGEGETLHTISDKCGDPFIVEKNPHIHDPDDVFPGLVIKITPSQHSY